LLPLASTLLTMLWIGALLRGMGDVVAVIALSIFLLLAVIS
jgi:hypothetical protein